MLKLYTIFHLNLAYSSVEEEDRKTIIEKCYWPLLNLAKNQGVPIGLEATAYTLSEINRIDPSWVQELANLWNKNKVEFIGSGYSQIIAPLVPSKLNRKNLELAAETYQELLGKVPEIALINEQSFSSSLIPLYKEANYKALVIDWADAASHHEKWPLSLGQNPQKAIGPEKSEIDILWSDATTFQKVQRYTHGDANLDDCISFLEKTTQQENTTLCLYGSDAETFNYRPGRYKSETNLSQTDEWQLFANLFNEIDKHPDMELCLPSQALNSVKNKEKQSLNITTESSPISVKKQRKYNIARWAVTGRADATINAACQKIYEQIKDNGSDQQWRELCFLWSSDFRTHIGDKRWQNLLRKLAEKLPQKPSLKQTKLTPLSECKLPDGYECWVEDSFITLKTPSSSLRLNMFRGISIDRFSPNTDDALSWIEKEHENYWLGTISHCYYKDVEWGADYYSGHLTLDLPGEHKITDLHRCEPKIYFNDNNNSFVIKADINSGKGEIEKTLTLNGQKPDLTIKYQLSDELFRVGSLRLGNITLSPDNFDKDSLYFSTHNGGEELEEYDLAKEKINHGKIISTLISSSFGLGLTEGELNLGDNSKEIKITFNRSNSCFLGLINSQNVKESYFCRASLSLIEMDDTSRKFDNSIFQLLEKPAPELTISLIKK